MANRKNGSLKASAAMKFRQCASGSSQSSCASKVGGCQPVAQHCSIGHILLLVMLYVCRRVLLVGVDVKLGVYAFVLVVVSTIGELAPIPLSYFANRSNALNQYFVKIGWAWTLSVIGALIVLTADVTCCSQRWRMRRHLMRLAFATAAWYFSTGLFGYIESATGICRCRPPRPLTRFDCRQAGFVWTGFDISGHAFLLIFSNLVIMEESLIVDGWESVADMIRSEDHARVTSTSSSESTPSASLSATISPPQASSGVGGTPLQHVSTGDYQWLCRAYSRNTALVRTLVVVAAALSLLWDVMLVVTALYFHTVLQKVVGGCVAVLAWFLLYRCVFPAASAAGYLWMPGDGGLFRYSSDKRLSTSNIRRFSSSASAAKSRRAANSTGSSSVGSSRAELPTFMGMPLYALRNRTAGTSSTAGTCGTSGTTGTAVEPS